MTSPAILAAGAAASLILVAAAVFLLASLRHDRRVAMRVLMSRGEARPAPWHAMSMLNASGGIAERLGRALIRSGIVSTGTVVQYENSLGRMGVYGRRNVTMVIGGKITLFFACPVVAGVLAHRAVGNPAVLILLIMAAALAGLFLPEMCLRYQRRGYLRRVEHGLSDALDLLVICAGAGLGLTAALSRVVDELAPSEPAIAGELRVTLTEITFLADSRKALLNLGTRTNVEGLSRLGVTLVQSMQYGTPMADALRLLSADIREATLTRFEARAARLGVLLTMPMVFFILPCVFLIVGGPAVIQAIHAVQASH